MGGIGGLKLKQKLSIIQLRASKCTHDDEKNENNDEMKRKGGWNLLGHYLIASEAPQGAAWLHGVFNSTSSRSSSSRARENGLLRLHTFNLK